MHFNIYTVKLATLETLVKRQKITSLLKELKTPVPPSSSANYWAELSKTNNMISQFTKSINKPGARVTKNTRAELKRLPKYQKDLIREQHK